MDAHGRPVRELSDAELEQQGAQAHATRNWVFLHGSAEQFERHTDRMLELEQEYLRRHPKRTWQGSSGEPVQIDQVAAMRSALRSVIVQLNALLADDDLQQDSAAPTGDRLAELLGPFAAAPGSRLHRLEVHQIARRAGIAPASLAQLYRGPDAFLAVDGADRVLTDAGRAWLAGRS